MKKAVFYILILTIIWQSCNTNISGELNANKAPETYLIIDTILRIGEDRLDSQVELKWWSDDVDGFVTSYEFTFDENLTTANWVTTEKQDSVFLLATPAGFDTIDYKFSIRAIDNLNAKDETPASIYIPIKNTAPTVNFVNNESLPTQSLPVFKVFWEVFDKDGFENIDYLQIGLNDSVNNLITVSKNITAATFEKIENSNEAKIYLNNNTTAEDEILNGFLLNDTNYVFVRAIDKSEAKSNFARSKKVYIKEQQSNILFIDAYFLNGQQILDFYQTELNNIGYNNFDILNLFETNDAGFKTQASVDNLTQSRVFNLYDIIIWVGNDAEENLVLAQRTTFDFFNNGGKLLMSLKIGSAFDEQIDVSDFTPIESFVSPIDTTLILEIDKNITGYSNNFPQLKSSSFVSPIVPFNINFGSTIIYEADLTARKNSTNEFSSWNGNSTIVASKKNNNGNTNFIFSCVELHQLNANNNFGELLQNILINEFGE